MHQKYSARVQTPQVHTQLTPQLKIKPFASQRSDPSTIPKQQLIMQLKNYNLKCRQDVCPETHQGEKNDGLSQEVISSMLGTKLSSPLSMVELRVTPKQTS